MPSVGLGIPVPQDPEKYRVLIDRHGQKCRWRRARTCTCILETGSSADPQCTLCFGRGYVYDWQTSFKVESELTRHAGAYIRAKFAPVKSVQSILQRYGNMKTQPSMALTPGAINGDMVQFSMPVGETIPPAWVKIFMDYTVERLTRVTVTGFTHYGDGIVKMKTLSTGDPLELETFSIYTLETRKFYFDIVNIVSFTDETTHTAVPISRYARDTIVATAALNQAHSFKLVADVISPWQMLLSGISQKMRWEDSMTTTSGECQLTVPYNYAMGTGDIITTLAGERRGEVLLKYDAAVKQYELSAFDVSEILQISDSTGDTNFVEGVDFVFIPDDMITFLTAGKKPVGRFNVMFNYHPTFKVMDDIPMIRAAESKRFPRKCMLKVYSKGNNEYDPVRKP